MYGSLISIDYSLFCQTPSVSIAFLYYRASVMADATFHHIGTVDFSTSIRCRFSTLFRCQIKKLKTLNTFQSLLAWFTGYHIELYHANLMKSYVVRHRLFVYWILLILFLCLFVHNRIYLYILEDWMYHHNVYTVIWNTITHHTLTLLAIMSCPSFITSHFTCPIVPSTCTTIKAMTNCFA